MRVCEYVCTRKLLLPKRKEGIEFRFHSSLIFWPSLVSELPDWNRPRGTIRNGTRYPAWPPFILPSRYRRQHPFAGIYLIESRIHKNWNPYFHWKTFFAITMEAHHSTYFLFYHWRQIIFYENFLTKSVEI